MRLIPVTLGSLLLVVFPSSLGVAAEKDEARNKVSPVVKRINDARVYSFKLGVKGTSKEVSVQVREESDKERGQLRKNAVGDWLADSWYGNRILPYVIARACGGPAKGSVYLKFSFAAEHKVHTLWARGLAEDIYVLQALGFTKVFSRWMTRVVPSTKDVQGLKAASKASRDGKEEKLSAKLKPALALARSKYDEKRAELIKRFNRSYLYYPRAGELRWTLSRAADSLFLEAGCSDRMYAARFQVQLKRDKDGKWHYVKLLAFERFKGE